MVDPWIEKAWRMRRETECLSDVSILKAALSLEEKQNEAPDYDTAAVISLHYLVLALRKKEKGRPILREHYVSQALMWKREAINLLAQAASANA
ncbi:MAG TPA: hypothetical protein VHK27_01310 [Gammaproteobacteria bacterium]|nr:hypothetical protein [Gammaproteobacteria bacterium]